ncbi:MAG TPA: hypothetical protein VNJ08_09730 [Bacteriovoracaceae bacterium]|nr:hypothetical protein [Bacteriovoracaceae bacterium]
MKNLKQGLLLTAIVLSQPLLACTQDGKEGFVPKNDLFIAVDSKEAAGLTEVQFNAVIDKVETMYSPIVSTLGGELEVVRNWSDGTVNAYAEQYGTEWKVSMFGGLARHKTITEDGFALVVCHEIGHHIGGAPKYNNEEWASNEGQSDYFATTKCLRRVWMSDDNVAIVSKLEVPKALTDACNKNWTDKSDRAICIRGGMAGDSVAQLFAALSWAKPAKFETPDIKVVTRTSDSHPATQCRLDTYFQGALCEKSFNEDVATDSEVTGLCHGSTGHKIGLRPLCWFKPSL